MATSLVPEESASDLLSDAVMLDDFEPDINLLDGKDNKIRYSIKFN